MHELGVRSATVWRPLQARFDALISQALYRRRTFGLVDRRRMFGVPQEGLEGVAVRASEWPSDARLGPNARPVRSLAATGTPTDGRVLCELRRIASLAGGPAGTVLSLV